MSYNIDYGYMLDETSHGWAPRIRKDAKKGTHKQKRIYKRRLLHETLVALDKGTTDYTNL